MYCLYTYLSFFEGRLETKMGLMDEIKQKARSAGKRIVLPEGAEERTVKAAEIIAKEA